MARLIIVNLCLTLLYFTNAVNASGYNNPTTGTSIRPIDPTTGKSIRPIDPTTGKSIRPIDPTTGKSIRPIGEDVPKTSESDAILKLSNDAMDSIRMSFKKGSIRVDPQKIPTDSIRPISLKLTEDAEEAIKTSFKKGSIIIDENIPTDLIGKIGETDENIGSIRRNINTFPKHQKKEKNDHDGYRFHLESINQLNDGGWVAYYQCARRCKNLDEDGNMTVTRLINTNGVKKLNHEHAVDCLAKLPEKSMMNSEDSTRKGSIKTSPTDSNKKIDENIGTIRSKTNTFPPPPERKQIKHNDYRFNFERIRQNKRGWVATYNCARRCRGPDGTMTRLTNRNGVITQNQEHAADCHADKIIYYKPPKTTHAKSESIPEILKQHSPEIMEESSDDGSVQIIPAMPSHVQPRIRDNDVSLTALALDMDEMAMPNSWLGNNVIDAYLDLITRGRDDARFVPCPVIQDFRDKKGIAPNWRLEQFGQDGIWSVQFWIIPAHLHRTHWALAVFDLKNVVFCDSLNNGVDTEENGKFRKDLFDFFATLYGDSQYFNMDQVGWINRPDIPRQMNTWDCGVFLLMYAEEIIRNRDIMTYFHFNQDMIPECRTRIYRELLAHHFPEQFALFQTATTGSIRPIQIVQSIRSSDKKTQSTSIRNTKSKLINEIEKTKSIRGMKETKSITPHELYEPNTTMEVDETQSNDSTGSGISGSIRHLDGLQIESIRKKKKMESGIIHKSIREAGKRKTPESNKIAEEIHDSIKMIGVKFVKNEFGGYLLVHDGYIYKNARNFDSKNREFGLWMCEERDTEAKCMGEVTINDDNIIIDKKEHSHNSHPESLNGLKTYNHFKDQLTHWNLQNLRERKRIYLDGYVYIYNITYDLRSGKQTHLNCEEITTSKCPAKAKIQNEQIEVTIQHTHKGKTIVPGNGELAEYAKHPFGGYYMLHDGFIYEKEPKNKWACEERKKDSSCLATASVDDDNWIIYTGVHNHERRQMRDLIPMKNVRPNGWDELSDENKSLTAQGKPITHDGYRYAQAKKNITNQNRYYRCITKFNGIGCTAWAYIEDGLIDVRVQHNHERKN